MDEMAGPSSVAADCNTSGNCAKKAKKKQTKKTLPQKKPFIDSKVAVQILNLVFLVLVRSNSLSLNSNPFS